MSIKQEGLEVWDGYQNEYFRLQVELFGISGDLLMKHELMGCYTSFSKKVKLFCSCCWGNQEDVLRKGRAQTQTDFVAAAKVLSSITGKLILRFYLSVHRNPVDKYSNNDGNKNWKPAIHGIG